MTQPDGNVWTPPAVLAVATEIVETLENKGAKTWSLHRSFPVPTDGFLVSAPLMGASWHGVPSVDTALLWLEINRAELTSGFPFSWRREIREHYASASPPRTVAATPHRAEHQIQSADELFFPGAWMDSAGVACLDVNLWYGPMELERARINGAGWNQQAIYDLAQGLEVHC